MNDLYAHTPPPGSTNWHLLVDHLLAVAAHARSFAEPFGAGDLAYYLGLWHDVGKSTPAFQAYLKNCHEDPTYKQRGPDHKAAGAALAQRYHLPLLALLVQGHHGGLRNKEHFNRWFAERQSDRTPDGQYSAIDAAIAAMRSLLPTIEPTEQLSPPAYVQDQKSAEFFLRMLFSSLVDADFLDTEQHRKQINAAHRGTSITLADLWPRFEASQQQLVSACSDQVLQARRAIYEACLAAAVQPLGLFRLAVPTGGGKTRSAMAFALRHAHQHGLQRIIVAVPYISITEQTADVYRGIFETATEEVPTVLEHHSGAAARHADPDDYSTDTLWTRLAAENWDAPVIVTTTVQLFESLFTNQTSRCRKLHRLAKSIIILDEAQALPTGLLTPILDGIRELCENYGATVVLSTATQPAFESISTFANLSAYDIIPDAARWFAALKRVTYEWQLDRPRSWGEIADQMRSYDQTLAVVNTRKDALSLLDALDDPAALHLSTLLCGAHRRDVIATVKRRLEAGEPCHLISTQVIEAGVDLDFPRVLRAIGPLDGIIQAAGRCNRGGNLERGTVLVFDPAEGGIPPGAYAIATNTTRSILGSGSFDPNSPDDIHRYFQRFFDRPDTDEADIQGYRARFKFLEVAQHFRMIDDHSEEVIVSYGSEETHQQIARWVERLRHKPPDARAILRRLQPYLVSVPRRQAETYRGKGLLDPLPGFDGLGVWHGTYDAVRGLGSEIDRSLLTLL